MGKACMRLNRAQEKTLSLKRSTQVPTVPKGNSRIPADTFSPTRTFLFFFRLRLLKNAADISIQLTREPFALESRAAPTLPTFEWIAILHENSVSNASADRDRVNRSVLGEAAENRELRDERVAVCRSSQSGARILLDSVHRVVHKRACGVTHHACGFATLGECFLSAPQRRFHGVDVHCNIGERCHDFLLFRQRFAEFLHCCARCEQEDLLGLC